MKEVKLKIFCDFDGTVMKNDVWIVALGKFIKDKKKFDIICEDFISNTISARECNLRELDLIKDFNFDELNSYLDEEELDGYFKEFTRYCKENNYEITLLSEGLDYYINYILNKENLDLKYFSNKLIVKEFYNEVSGKSEIKLTCEFPYTDEQCTYCGMSKRNIILTNTNDFENEVSVFIGDGISDFCASNYADIVFAKKRLASYCWKNNITYFEFNNFKDIILKIEKLKKQNKLKQKQTAWNLRKDVFMGG